MIEELSSKKNSCVLRKRNTRNIVRDEEVKDEPDRFHELIPPIK
jgi:hypothetical protein